MRTIERNAFSYSGLEELYLPESVAYIAPDALKYCSKVKLWVVEDSYAATFAQENELNYSARLDWL